MASSAATQRGGQRCVCIGSSCRSRRWCFADRAAIGGGPVRETPFLESAGSRPTAGDLARPPDAGGHHSCGTAPGSHRLRCGTVRRHANTHRVPMLATRSGGCAQAHHASRSCGPLRRLGARRRRLGPRRPGRSAAGPSPPCGGRPLAELRGHLVPPGCAAGRARSGRGEKRDHQLEQQVQVRDSQSAAKTARNRPSRPSVYLTAGLTGPGCSPNLSPGHR